MNVKEMFPDFDQPLIEELEKIGSIVEFHQGDMLMRTGQYFKNTLLILEGMVKLYREGDDGGEFFLYYLEPGNACALSMICATRNETSQIKAIADTPVKALTVPIQHMDDLIRNHRNWYYFVLENYRNRFEELLQVVDQVAFHSMDEKLEFYLARQFAALQSESINITHQQIADDLNSSREVISRLLKKMENRKMIDVSRNEIRRLKNFTELS
ncbi:MAG: Crp/Fnr family transcriptional regulator [Flammeovirgaceae bacterium]|nr:Crp/Fnr family transcriptional regulator [Flammeovirgaceae bacterium]